METQTQQNPSIETQTPQEHSSVVGGSTARRRLECPASLTREAASPKMPGSKYAREGTAMHELIAWVLLSDGAPTLPYVHKQPEKYGEAPWEYTITTDLWDALGQSALDMFDDYLNWLEDDQEGAAAAYLVETRAAFPGIENAFGTADIIVRCGDVVVIWDWKFGRGVVPADDNAQLLFYAAAARNTRPDMFKGAKRLILAICQPLVNDQEPDTWETTFEDLDDYILDLQDAIELAKKPDPVCVKGPWCQYADCKLTCPEHISAAEKLGKMMQGIDEKVEGAAARVTEISDVQTIDDVDTQMDLAEFLATAMELAEAAESWAKHVAALSQSRLERGLPVNGWKVVDKKSSGREWTADDKIVVSRLRTRGLKADDYYVKKLVTPPQAEKVLKKMGKELPDDIVRQKPSSGYTLTRDGDPRVKATTPAEKATELAGALNAMIDSNKEHENG